MVEARGRPQSSCQSCRENKRRCNGALPKCAECWRKGRSCLYQGRSKCTIRNKPTEAIVGTDGCIRGGDEVIVRLATEELQESTPSAGAFQPELQEPPAAVAVIGRAIKGTAAIENAPRTSMVVKKHASPPMASHILGIESTLLPRPKASLFSVASSTEFSILGRSRFNELYPDSKTGHAHLRYLHYAASILEDGRDVNGMLSLAISAVGLAALGNKTGHGGLLQKAHFYYSKTLKSIATVVANPETINADITLMSVIVASLFETVTWNECSVDNWVAHIKGVVAIVTQPGYGQFTTVEGPLIYWEAMGHILTFFQEGMGRLDALLPRALAVLTSMPTPCSTQRDHRWVLTNCSTKLVELQEHVRLGDLEKSFCDATDFYYLAQAREINQLLESAFSFPELPRAWRYETTKAGKASRQIVYSDVSHVYNDTYIAKVWNSMRTTRLLTQYIIAALLTRLSGTDQPWPLVLKSRWKTIEDPQIKEELGKVFYTITRLRDEILASMPQLTGYIRETQDPDRFQQPTGAGCYFVIWLLYISGSVPTNDAYTTDWAIQRLRSVFAVTGVRKAEYFAQLLGDLARQPEAEKYLSSFPGSKRRVCG